MLSCMLGLSVSPPSPEPTAISAVALGSGQPLCLSSTFFKVGEPAWSRTAVQRPGSMSKLLMTWIGPRPHRLGWRGTPIDVNLFPCVDMYSQRVV